MKQESQKSKGIFLADRQKEMKRTANGDASFL
jgi:hypothetical protein